MPETSPKRTFLAPAEGVGEGAEIMIGNKVPPKQSAPPQKEPVIPPIKENPPPHIPRTEPPLNTVTSETLITEAKEAAKVVEESWAKRHSLPLALGAAALVVGGGYLLHEQSKRAKQANQNPETMSKS